MHKQMATSKTEAPNGSKGSSGHDSDYMRNIVPAHLSSVQDISNPQRFHTNSTDNLSEQLRQISVSNHGMVAQQHSKMPVCCDPNFQRNSLSVSQCPRPEKGPPELHADHPIAKHSFQRSSPANLQQGRSGRSSGTPLTQQQWNMANPYQSNPHMPAQFTLPPYALYQSRVVDPHFASNQSQPALSPHVLRNYPMPPHSQGPPPVHPHYMGAPFYVAPINVSTGSNNSLSRSFPHIPSTERVVEPFIAQNYGSSSSHSDPHGYSFQSNMSSRRHQPGTPHEIVSPNHSRLQHVTSVEPPLSSEKNPRFYLYRNLCGLFQRPVVEAVMKAHPDVKEPKKIISLIQQMIE